MVVEGLRGVIAATSQLEAGRFENGWIVLDGFTGGFPVKTNQGRVIVLEGSQSAFVKPGTHFKLYDDDDFSEADHLAGRKRTGDEGRQIPFPDISLLASAATPTELATTNESTSLRTPTCAPFMTLPLGAPNSRS